MVVGCRNDPLTARAVAGMPVCVLRKLVTRLRASLAFLKGSGLWLQALEVERAVRLPLPRLHPEMQNAPRAVAVTLWEQEECLLASRIAEPAPISLFG